MSNAIQQSAALRFMEMAIEPKRLAKAREAFKSAHKAELMDVYREAQRTLENTTGPDRQ